MNRLFEAEVFVRVVEDGSLTAAAKLKGWEGDFRALAAAAAGLPWAGRAAEEQVLRGGALRGAAWPATAHCRGRARAHRACRARGRVVNTTMLGFAPRCESDTQF